MKVTMKQILERLAEIKIELEDENVDVEKLEEEARSLLTEKQKIEDEEQKRSKILSDISTGVTGQKIDSINFSGKREESREDEEPKEYRAAFLKNLLGQELTELEQRAFTHTVENTGAVVPKETLNKIYSNMEEEHPILKDVQVLRTGTVINITKHTTIVSGDAKAVAENEANDDEQNTFVSVSLAGKDFSKSVEFSYKLGKMAIPAFEEYLVNEISGRIGAAMAKDIYTKIKTDTNSKNKMNVASTGSIAFKDVTKALGLLKTSKQAVVYANREMVWNGIANIEGAEGRQAFVPNMQDGLAGRLIGNPVKIEESIEKGVMLILAPAEFIFNVVQDIMIERDKDIKRHVHILSGYASAEGALVNDLAAVIVTVGAIG